MKKTVITFANEQEGLLTEDGVRRLFNNPQKIVGVAEGLCAIVDDPDEGRVLRVTYPAGVIQEDKTRWHYKFDAVDTATVTYKVMVPVGFDFVRGGKLPGLYGGTAPRGGASTDAGDGFSARVMWREGGELYQYMYWMERVADKKWGDDLPWANVNGDRQPLSLIPGKWHTLKTQIKLNTPGERDGTVTSWLDGELAVEESGAFRAEGQTFGIDTFAFTTFFGGNDVTWAPTKEEVAYFGDITLELG